ncbi:MAG: DUF7508 domain-containing protein [Rhodospirillales bacterium]
MRLDKPWINLTKETIAKLPGQLGVFQLARKDDCIFYIGYAGGHSLFGLRSELEKWREKRGSEETQFRYEINMQYMTRHQELLMLYVAEYNALPIENTDVDSHRLGRLRPA